MTLRNGLEGIVKKMPGSKVKSEEGGGRGGVGGRRGGKLKSFRIAKKCTHRYVERV